MSEIVSIPELRARIIEARQDRATALGVKVEDLDALIEVAEAAYLISTWIEEPEGPAKAGDLWALRHWLPRFEFSRVRA